MYAYYSPLLHIVVNFGVEFVSSACGYREAGLESLSRNHHLWLVFATPPGINIEIPTDLAAFKAVGHLDSWMPTSAGTGVARYSITTTRGDYQTPSGCLLLSRPGSYR